MWTVIYQCHHSATVNVMQGFDLTDFVTLCMVLRYHGYEFLAEKSDV